MTSQDRRHLLEDLAAFKRPIQELLESLSALPWDSDDEPVELTREKIADVLDRFVRGELTADQIEEWADALEVREDVDYPPEDEELLSKVIYQLANPALEGPITVASGQALIETLQRYRK